MMNEAGFIFSPEQLKYKFSEHHPFNQKRLILTIDLLEKVNALDTNTILPARMATDSELLLIHDEDYIRAVKDASAGKTTASFATKYGIGTEDTPVFPDMHEAAAWLVGGTLSAVDLVFEHGFKHALNLGGGLHHGFRGKASGFCVYNDSSIAIEYMRRKYQARVLYIDTDAHHGDGVQWAFYDDPEVCTISLHESGRFLFPGTGSVNERGTGDGYGYSFNVPLEAFTEDNSFLYAYEKIFREVTKFFKPDVIITQNGADAHCFDPLTHLCGTTKMFFEIPKLAHELAHEYCDGRWIAVGGGGYDIWRVVPRAWSALWLEMTEQTSILKEPIPESWISRWQSESKETLPTSWYDEDSICPVIPRRNEIKRKNERTLQSALKSIKERRRK